MDKYVKLEDLQAQAAAIIESDLIDARSNKAVCAVLKLAVGRAVTPSDFVAVCHDHRAPLRIVAASVGWATCRHCGEWIELCVQPSNSLNNCAHVAEFRNDEELAGAVAFALFRGSILQTFVLPASYTKRQSTAASNSDKSASASVV
jgi:hypothetical protein